MCAYLFQPCSRSDFSPRHMIRLAPPKVDTKALVEAGLMLSAVVGAGRWVRPDDPWLLQLNPHPFWGVILLIAVRYGMPTAPVVGAACGALHLVGMQQSGHALADAFQLGGSLLLMPLFYLVVSVIIGEAMEQARRRSDHFRSEAGRSLQKLASSEARAAALELAYRQVEGRLAGRTDTVISLYDGARRLASFDRNEIFQGVMQLLTGHLGVERAGIWVGSDLGGYTKLLPESESQASLPELGEAVLAEGMVLGAHEHYLGRDAPLDAGLLAGPLRADSARIEAVVVIESLRFTGFTPALIREFELLLDWASRALGNAARAAAVVEAGGRRTGAITRVQGLEEAMMHQRSDQPAMLMTVRLEGDLNESVRSRLELVVRRVCRNLTRPTDTVSWKPLDRATVLFLPGAYGQAGDNLRERIEHCLGSFEFRPQGDQREPVLRWSLVAVMGDANPNTMYRDALVRMRGD